MDGGTVEVSWEDEKVPVYMTGPAEYVCEGEILRQ
jgi:diaminopimelate epimerase